METAMRNVSISDRTTPSMSPLIKAEPASQQEQPIDFSTKVRIHTIDTDESASRKVSNDSAIDVSADANEHSSNTELTNEHNRQHLLTGQPRVPPTSMQIPNISTFLPPTSASMAGMGMFYPGPPVFPNFLPSPFNAGPMWPNPMAAMMQQQQEAARKLLSQAAINSKQPPGGGAGLRPPFGKNYLGKQDIMGGRGFPAMPGFPNPALGSANINNIPDPSILAEALKSHEEMFTAYKQQVLTQKASEDAKRSSRRQPPATITNGNHSSISQQNGSGSSSYPESSSLSQISEDQTPMSPTQQPHDSFIATKYSEELASNNGTDKTGRETSSSSDEDKHSPSGSVDEMNTAETLATNGNVFARSTSNGNGLMPPTTNGNGVASAEHSIGTSLHSSDESLQTSDGGRRSLTPAHSSNGELNDLTGMRPRSMTLPTQMTVDSRFLSHSPSPSVLSTGNNSSGPATPNSKIDRGFRKRARTLPDDQKIKKRDDAYWERRRKNNEAAKRSRDSRRAKEDEIAIRAAFLEQENIRLRLELASLKTQTAKLRSELIIFQGPEEHRVGSSTRPNDGS